MKLPFQQPEKEKFPLGLVAIDSTTTKGWINFVKGKKEADLVSAIEAIILEIKSDGSRHGNYFGTAKRLSGRTKILRR